MMPRTISALQRLRRNLRGYMAEMFLGWALAWTPKGSDEELAMCYAIATYQDMLKEQAHDASPAERHRHLESYR